MNASSSRDTSPVRPSGMYPDLNPGAGAGAGIGENNPPAYNPAAAGPEPSAPTLSGDVDTAAAGAARAVAATAGKEAAEHHVTIFGYEYSEVRNTLLLAYLALLLILASTATHIHGESLEKKFEAEGMNGSLLLLALAHKMRDIWLIMLVLTPFIGVGTKPAATA